MRQYFLEGLVSQGADFGVVTILNGMRHVTDGWLKAERCALRGGRFDKFIRCDEHAWNPEGFEVSDVVHTARRA